MISYLLKYIKKRIKWFVNLIKSYFNKIKITFYVFLQKVFKLNLLTYDESHNYVLKKVNYTVLNGPFKDMKYINKSNGSELFPKLIGYYEYCIQHIIEEIIKYPYKNYIDIGCAEGYYAVGLAYRISKFRNDFTVYAYDINSAAINNLKELANRNNVTEFIVINQLFKIEDFNHFVGESVVICDIEGAEKELLNPQIANKLYDFDILVEVHDEGKKSNLIKSILKERFSKTHIIEIIDFNQYDKHIFKYIHVDFERKFMDEGRRYGIEWMWIKKIKSSTFH